MNLTMNSKEHLADSALPLVSIIILNFNAESIITNCLRSVLATDYPNFELKFVDNASTDSSVEIVSREFSNDPRLKIVRNAKNLGWPAGIMSGLKHCSGKYIAITEPDTETDTHWIRELVSVMESDSSIGAAQCKLLFLNDKRKFDSIGGELDYFGIESPKSALAVGETDRGQYNKIREIFYARGAAFIFSKEKFLNVGELDESYYLGGYDDIDLCWRMRLNGLKVVFVPQSIVYHAGGRLIARTHWPFWYYHTRKNHIATLIRNYEYYNIVRFLPGYLTLAILYGMYQSTKRRPLILKATLQAIFWNIKNLRQSMKRRKFVQTYVRTIPDESIISMMTKPVFHRHIISSELINKIPGKVYYSKLEGITT